MLLGSCRTIDIKAVTFMQADGQILVRLVVPRKMVFVIIFCIVKHLQHSCINPSYLWTSLVRSGIIKATKVVAVIKVKTILDFSDGDEVGELSKVDLE